MPERRARSYLAVGRTLHLLRRDQEAQQYLEAAEKELQSGTELNDVQKNLLEEVVKILGELKKTEMPNKAGTPSAPNEANTPAELNKGDESPRRPDSN